MFYSNRDSNLKQVKWTCVFKTSILCFMSCTHVCVNKAPSCSFYVLIVARVTADQWSRVHSFKELQQKVYSSWRWNDKQRTVLTSLRENEASSDKLFQFCNNGVKLCLSVLTIKIETVTEIWNLLTSQKTSCGFRHTERGATSPLLEAVLLPFIKQVCFRTSQIDNLRTAISLRNRTNIIQKSQHFSQSVVYSSRHRLNQLKRDADPGNVRNCNHGQMSPVCVRALTSFSWMVHSLQ